MSNDNEILKVVSAYLTTEQLIVNWDIIEDGKVVDQTSSRFRGENRQIFLKQTCTNPKDLDSLTGQIFIGRTYTNSHSDTLFVEPTSLRRQVRLSNPVLAKVVVAPAKTVAAPTKVVTSPPPISTPTPVAPAPIATTPPAPQAKKYNKSVEHNARVAVDYFTRAQVKINKLIDLKAISDAELQALNKLSEKISSVYNEQCNLKKNIQ